MNANENSYQGWANYPTWCVNLWLSNDEPLYRETCRMAADAVNEASDHPNIAANIWTEEQARRFVLADALKSWVCDELAPDLGASFPADLLGYALGQVSWDEIADAWIEDAASQVNA